MDVVEGSGDPFREALQPTSMRPQVDFFRKINVV